MKKYIIYLLLISTTFQINAQQEITQTTLSNKQTKQIKKTFHNYFKDITSETKDWEALINYTYPALFELISKKDMVNKLKTSFTNDLFTITFDKMALEKIGKSISFKDIIYCKVFYKSTMSFHFIKSEDQKEEEFNEYVTLMFDLYKNQFKDSKVTKINNTIKVENDKVMIAIHNSDLERDWYLLELLKNNEDYYAMFLPQEIATYISSKF